jgi:hypothetical protein
MRNVRLARLDQVEDCLSEEALSDQVLTVEAMPDRNPAAPATIM